MNKNPNSKIHIMSTELANLIAAGEVVAFVSAKVAGAVFKPFGVIFGITFDNAAMVISTVVLAFVVLAVYMVRRRTAIRMVAGSMRKNAAVSAAAHHAYDVLYGTLILMAVLSLALVLA